MTPNYQINVYSFNMDIHTKTYVYMCTHHVFYEKYFMKLTRNYFK